LTDDRQSGLDGFLDFVETRRQYRAKEGVLKGGNRLNFQTSLCLIAHHYNLH